LRKVKDYYYQKAKLEKYPARSVYKLEEPQKKYRFLRKGDSVLDLGCQPGSWTLYAARQVGPQGLVVGVDLKEGEKTSLSGAATINWLRCDIMEPDCVKMLQQQAGSVFQVVLSDMAPSTSGNKWVDQQRTLQLARRALAIAEQLLQADGNFYCKVFQGEDVDDFVKEIRGRFSVTRIIKPKSSRSESREVFVLGMGYLKSD
jgi:23S rRNA (uridine2552-2'-O)-methyltransferase